MTPTKAKIRFYAYRAAIILVAICAIYGYLKGKREEVTPVKQTQSVLSSDSSLTIESGDTINIDMVGYVDGEEVENTKGEGWEFTIGAGKLMDDIEAQIIGHHPGDSYTIEITFPDDYSDKDLRGKPATIEMTINGKYVEEEVTD